jgi:hypothetical protein
MTAPTYYIVAPGIAMAFWNDGDVMREAPLKSDGTPDIEKAEEIPASTIIALHVETGVSMLEDYIEKRINGDA